MKTIQVLLPEDVIIKLKQQAKDEDRSISQLLRFIVKNHFNKQSFQEKIQP